MIGREREVGVVGRSHLEIRWSTSLSLERGGVYLTLWTVSYAVFDFFRDFFVDRFYLYTRFLHLYFGFYI